MSKTKNSKPKIAEVK